MSNFEVDEVYDRNPDFLDQTKLSFWRLSAEKLLFLAVERGVEPSTCEVDGESYTGFSLVLDKFKGGREELVVFINHTGDGENYLLINSIEQLGENGFTYELRRNYDVRYRRDGLQANLGEGSRFCVEVERKYVEQDVCLIRNEGGSLSPDEQQKLEDMKVNIRAIENYHLDEAKLLIDRASDVLTLGLTNPS